MNPKLAVCVKVAFGLSFDVEKTSETRSGFKPAIHDHISKKELFGDVRLQGFTALLQSGFSDYLFIVGGNESRYKSKPLVNRANAIRWMLIEDMGISPFKISNIYSYGDTFAAIVAIQEMIKGGNLDPHQYALVSSFYHLPRVTCDLQSVGLEISTYPAEAFYLLEDEKRKSQLIERFGGGRLAERIVEEIQGIAHKLLGCYKGS